MDDDDPVRRLAQQIASYLEAHPDAVDTADGIRRWWLAPRGIEATPEQLQRALDRTVADGTVERRTLPDGRSVYARAAGGGTAFKRRE